MGLRQARRFQPVLDSLETRQVLSASASNPVVHTAIAPVSVPIATYNQTFTQINRAFTAYEGPYDGAINALGSIASGLVSTISTLNSLSDPNAATVSADGGSFVQSSKGDANALQGRLQVAIGKLPGGQAEANTLINRTFQYGGLTTSDAGYFKAKLSALVKQYVTQQIHRGEMVLVWPGQTRSGHRS